MAARPLVLHVPHASREIPEDVRTGIVLDDAALDRELAAMTDAFTDVIAAGAAARAGVGAEMIAATASRLVVDVERFTDGTEPMEAVGMGPVYTRTHAGDVLRETTDPFLLGRFFHPHAEAVSAAVDAALEAHGRALVIDVHSYPTHRLPYEVGDDAAARPEICLGTDPMHTPEWLLGAAREAFAGFEVGLDTPFAGAYVPLGRLHVDPRVVSIMIEIRRDQYMDESTLEPHTGLGRVTDALAGLLRACDAGAPAWPSLEELARAIAVAAHRGQVDKAGVEYWRHPERVAGHLRRLYPDASEEALAAAWLHDAIEDTPWTASSLVDAGIPVGTVAAVVTLTRRDDVPSEVYYRGIREFDGIALQVKHADIADNTDPVRVAALEAIDPERAGRLRVKYAHASELLGLTPASGRTAQTR